ncbi:hypothetical protein GLOIN_2v1470219 [Rhizophagus irregularis DAOM 181602=DAOM 197198]|nr:hypothetical protein GLOIN_2v1470219 [Rhizophagus irregularis DAOM 181602=DAOM 197198]
MSNKKDLEKVDELLAFTQQAKYFFEKISNIIQGQQEQQNNESYEVLGSSQTVSSRGSSQAGSQQEPILILSNENITIKMEKSDTAVTSGISKKGKESAVTSATNEKYRKRLKRGRLIKHLQMVKNSLVKKFKDEGLQLIIDNNAYHSPKKSKTDCENERRNIIVKDLKKLRERVMGNYFCNNEPAAPLLVLHWTRSRYKGKLKITVIQQLDQRQDQQHDLMKFAKSEKSFNDGYNTDIGEGEEEIEETVLLTSTDQPSNQSSDQSSNQQPSDQSSN